MEHTELSNIKIDAVVFLDRDGTVTKEKGIIKYPEALEFERGAINAIRQLNELKIPVFIITNQPGISKRIIEDYEAVNDALFRMMKQEGLRLNGVYTCPHTENDGCDCRKPSPVLIKQALRENRLSPKRIYTVGDRLHDVEMANMVGGKGFLVKTGFGASESRSLGSADGYCIADDVEDAVRRIIMSERAAGKAVFPIPQYRWPEISSDIEKSVNKQLYASLSIRTHSGSIDSLEANWAEKIGRKYAIAYSSGTMALFAAYYSIGLQKGDEIIAPAYGYFATVSSLLIRGISVVFADTDEGGNLLVSDIEKRITKRTKAIVVSHLYGNMADCKAVLTIAEKYNLTIVEDASHALGASKDSFSAGKFGDVSVFSLQANKLAPAGEGGILLTDNMSIAQTAATIGHFRQYSQKFFVGSEELYPYLTTGMGFKLRIHPLAAAVGVESLAKVDEIRAGRLCCARKMMSLLSQVGLKNTGPLHTLSLYNLPLLLPDWAAGKMDYIVECLKSAGCTADLNHNSNCVLPTLPVFHTPNYYYPNIEKSVSDGYPYAERFAERIFLLPLWHREYEHEIGMAYAEAVCEILNRLKEEVND